VKTVPKTKARKAKAQVKTQVKPTKAAPGLRKVVAHPARQHPVEKVGKVEKVEKIEKFEKVEKIEKHEPKIEKHEPKIEKHEPKIEKHEPKVEKHDKPEKADYATGDHVVYPTHGVGKITSIEIQEIVGQKLKLFVIQFEKDRMTLRVPVGKAKTSGLRKLSSKKEMQTALTTLKGRSRVKRTMWSRRAQEYEAKINSGDPRSIAEVVRDLHRNAGQPDQSFSERQMYQSALERLVREFAAVERISEETAVQRLEAMLKAA
jgi:CarD family transcriptional regulator